MGNPLKGEVTLEAGDSSYRLVFNINTLCTLEDHLGMSVGEIAKGMSGDVSLSFMRSVLWAGLQEHHADMTIKRTGDLMGLIGPANVGPLVTSAFSAAFGTEDAEGDGGPQPPPAKRAKTAGTGSTSSESGTN